MENYKNLTFEQPKEYGKYISISNVLGLIQEPFDQKGVAQKTHDKHFNNPDSQYYQKSVEEICEMWSAKGAESCSYGSMLDDYIGFTLNEQFDERELFELDHDRDGDERLNGLCNAFDLFVNEVIKTHPNLVYVTREQTVYYPIMLNDELNYVMGRFDALFYNTDNGHYVIVDWKSSGEIDKEPNKWTKKLLGAAKSLWALNLYTYSLQVYFYKTALEQAGYIPENSIVDCMIVQFAYNKKLENNKPYCTYVPPFPYDKSLMDSIYTFAIKKKKILDKKQ